MRTGGASCSWFDTIARYKIQINASYAFTVTFRTGGVTVVIRVTKKDIAFMFSLYESYKLNNVDFGHYIIPCNYVDRPLEEEAAT